MIKKTIVYDNFEGDEVTEDHYFNIGPKEIVDLEAEFDTGIEAWLKQEIESGDPKRALAVIVKFVARGYGVREGENGFKKSEEITDNFLTSLAGMALFDDLLTDQESINDFVVGMLPKKLMAKAEQILAERAAVKGIVLESRIETAPDVVDVELPKIDREVWDDEYARQREDLLSGLKHPRDANGALWPWAFREPTRKEMTHMGKTQFVDVTRRKNDPEWEPTVGG